MKRAIASRSNAGLPIAAVIENHSRPNVTDRALRYRANNEPPEGRKVCAMCGSTRFVEIDHIDGFEENGEAENLMWICRSCNTRKGVAMRNAHLGRRTHQYNPAGSGGAKSLGQWVIAVMSAKGESDQMSVRDAVAMIHETPASRRTRFAEEIWERRRRRGTDREIPF
jgi:hypothetical protein